MLKQGEQDIKMCPTHRTVVWEEHACLLCLHGSMAHDDGD